jgi:signal transduction histidine kinase
MNSPPEAPRGSGPFGLRVPPGDSSPGTPDALESLNDPASWAPTASFLRMAMAFIMAATVGAWAMLLLFAPGQTGRQFAALALAAPIGAVWALAGRGRVRAAYVVLGVTMWVYVTASSSLFGGVASTTVIIYPLVIHLSGWLFGVRVGAAVAGLTVAATLGMALAQMLHWLPEPAPAPPLLRWVIQCAVFVVTAFLIAFYVRTYRQRLEKERELAHKLAQLNAELEQRVEARTEELRDSVAALESFSYSVAHDLRTPLRTIDGYNSIVLLEHGAHLPEDGRDLLERSRSGARRMATLIDGLLALSSVSRARPAMVAVDMQAIVGGICERIEARLDARIDERIDQRPEARLDGDADRGKQAARPRPPAARFQIDALPDAVGDPDLLTQVWVNLIENAVKFSAGVPDPLIEIGCIDLDGAQFKAVLGATPEGARGGLELRSEDGRPDAESAWQGAPVYFVRDHGIGFDMAYAGKLFRVFERLHPAGAFEGSGLGLAIVKRIVEHHRGRIWAHSEPGKGSTTFFFCLGQKRPERARTGQKE